jgi:sarcosine oxidase subunit gamma
MAEVFASVRDMGAVGMVTLRGDLSDARLQAVVTEVTGAAVPGPGRAHVTEMTGAAWMSPDEVLLVVPYARAAEVAARVAQALEGTHHLAVNVSDARSVFAIEGPGAAEVLAKLAPVDLHPATFGTGHFRRSRLGQIAAAFWREEGRFVVVCFRSVGDYTLRLLETSVADGPVGVF